jgi:hypothetical protein
LEAIDMSNVILLTTELIAQGRKRRPGRHLDTPRLAPAKRRAHSKRMLANLERKQVGK